MHPTTGSDTGDGPSVHRVVEDLLGERIEALAGWIQELDSKVRATSAAGDEKALKELRRALEAWSKRDPKFEDRLTDRVDVLADRLATLSSAVNTTTAAHAGSDGEIAALRRELEQAATKFESVLSDLRPASVSKELEELRKTVAALSAERPSRRGDKRVDGLSEKVDNLAERLDTLAKTVATTAAGLAGRDGELVGLQRALESGNARVEAMIANLRQEDLAPITELEERLESVARTVATATKGLAGREGDIAALRAQLEEGNAKVAAVVAELRQSVGGLATQVATVDAAASDTAAIDALESRLGSVGAKVDELGAQLDGVVTAVGIASEGQERELGALQRRFEDASSRFDAVLDELRQAFDALSETPAVDPELDARVERVACEIGTLTRRLAEAEVATSARSAEDASRATDIDRRLEEGNAKFEALATELGQSVRALASKVAAVDAVARDTDAVEGVASRVAPLEAKVDDIGTRLESALTIVESASAGLAGQQRELAELQQHLEDGSSRVGATIGEVRRELAELREAESVGSELDARLEQVALEVGGLARRLAEAEAVSAESSAQGVSRAADLERRVAEVAERLAEAEHARNEAAAHIEAHVAADLEPRIAELATRLHEFDRERAAGAANLARASETWAEERTWVREQLDALVTVVADMHASGPGGEVLEALAKRIAAMEEDRESVFAQAGNTGSEWAAAKDALEARLDELAAAIAHASSNERVESSPLPAEIVDRLEALERDSAAASSEVARTGSFWASELAAIEDRLEEVASARASVAHSDDEELERLLVAFADRIEAMESDRISLTARLDDVAAQLGTLESARRESSPTSEPATADGRFRAELRALEFRMEHAEAAARENREAVLVQLERLASRVEWRLQRLESDEAAGIEYPQPATRGTVGQVVPIRGGAET